MSESIQSVSRINEKIREGRCSVLTEREFLSAARRVRNLSGMDVDIVTLAVQAGTPGTAAMLCVPVAERGVFLRAEKIWINGVEGFPGPAPNERLGLVDTFIFASRPSGNKKGFYDGSHLFLDIISRKEVYVECLSAEGDLYQSSFNIEKLQFARIYVYNCSMKRLSPDFGVGRMGSAGHSGVISTGSKVLLNRAAGVVVGCGTNNSHDKMALSLTADMFDMDPCAMLEHSAGSMRVITNSVAIAIPVLSRYVLEGLFASLNAYEYNEPPEFAAAEDKMAGYLKRMVIDGKFSLTDSDLEL